MKKLFFLLASGFWLLSTGQLLAQNLTQITWITEEYAPYNYTSNGIPTGIMVDILKQMWQKAGLNKNVTDIKVMPWARGYKLCQENANVCLFSTTITEPRKKLFNFVGPAVPSEINIIAQKSKGYKINSINDLKKLKIGTVRQDVGEQLLLQAGIPKSAIDPSNSARSLVKKLAFKRVDAISYGFDTARYNMKLEGIDSRLYEIIYTLKKGAMGFAFSKKTNPEIINKLQQALDELKRSGTVESIVNQYLQ